MENFDKAAVLDFFLDSDSVSTVNTLVVAVANVVKENNENMIFFNHMSQKYLKHYENHTNVKRREDKTTRHRIKKFYENIVLNFTDEEYEERFKMKKSTVMALINYINGIDKKSSSSAISLDKKVHIFLWLMTSNSSYSEVANLFGMYKPSVKYIMCEMCCLLQEQYYDFINWPSTEEQQIISVKVNNKLKFPNCVGFIDSCRLKVGSTRSKKKQEIVLLQAVCDESLMFVDVCLGEIGKLNKEKVFKSSLLCRELKNFVAFENHILGDAEYKLRKNLITPFTCDELLTHEEMKFNELHWRARSHINRAFEILKSRFRRLSHLDIGKSENLNTIVIAACILHNFILLHEGVSGQVKEEIILCEDEVVIDRSIVKTALEKRQFLCNYVSYIDST